MVKKKTSKKLERSLRGSGNKKKSKRLMRVKPLEYILNEDNVGKAILECLQNNDPEGVMEVVGTYLDALNKSKFLEDGEIPKSTYHYSLKNQKAT